MIDAAKQRDTSNWSQEYRSRRTAAAREARAASAQVQRAAKEDDRMKILEWLSWMDYSCTKILCHLTGRSRRILDEMVTDGLIHHQQQLIKAGSRVKRHGGQYLPMTTVFLTKAGHTESRSQNPLRRHPDAPDMVRHNLMSQLVMLYLLNHPYSPHTSAAWSAYTPGTQHLSDLTIESKTKSKFKPDLQIEIQPPLIELFHSEIESTAPYGKFFVEVERSRKKAHELEKLAEKLKTMTDYGKPVLVTETRTFMDSLLPKLNHFLDIEDHIHYIPNNNLGNDMDFMDEVIHAETLKKKREQKVWCLVLQEDCPDLLELLP